MFGFYRCAIRYGDGREISISLSEDTYMTIIQAYRENYPQTQINLDITLLSGFVLKIDNVRQIRAKYVAYDCVIPV